MSRNGAIARWTWVALASLAAPGVPARSEEPPAPPAREEPDAGEVAFDGVAAPPTLEARLAGLEQADARARAIEAALDWFVAHQHPAGGWRAKELQWCDGVESQTPPDGPARLAYDAGVTGLALSAFHAAGHDHLDGGRRAPTCERAVRWLLSQQADDGGVAPRVTGHYIYEHGYAVRALLEAYAASGDPSLRAPLQRALDFTLAARNPKAGWRYGIRPKDNDAGVTGLLLLGLLDAAHLNEAAANAGLPEPFRIAAPPPAEDAVQVGARYLHGLTDEVGRGGYLARGSGSARTEEMVDKFPGDQTESMTAVALAVRSRLPDAWRREPGADALLQRSVGLVLALPPEWNVEKGTIDLYYWTYGAHALSRLAPDGWKAWDAALARALLPNQRTDGLVCEARGSWDAVDPWGPDAGRIYTTAMAAIALSAPGRVPEPAAAAAALTRDLARAELPRARVLRLLRTAEIRRPRGVESAVAGRLRSEDPIVRAAAARALGATAPTAATAAVLAKLGGDRDPAVRRAAFETLATLPAESTGAAGAAAVAGAADADAAVRRAALRVAAAAAPPPTGLAEAVTARLADADARVRAIAAGIAARSEAGAAAGREALATLATDADAEVRREALTAAAALVPVVPPLDMTLTKALDDPDPAARAIAAGALLRAGLSRERAQAALVEGVRAGSFAARLAALEALAGAAEPSPTVAAALVPAATAGPRALRVAALRALGRAGGADVLAYLYAACADADAAVARAGREAAQATGVAPALQAERLAQAMEGGDPVAVLGARQGLAILGPASVEVVRKRIADPRSSPETRLAFLPVVGDLGAAARPLEAVLVTSLAAETSPTVAAALADALARLPARDARAVAPLSTWAANANAAVSVPAVRALGAMAATLPAAEDALAAVATSPRAKAPTRLAAIQAVRGIKAPRSATIDAVLAQVDRDDADVAAEAESLLADLGRPGALRLAARLEGGSPERQIRLLRVLERLGPKGKAARNAAQKLTSSPIPPVADAARRALAAIGG